MRTNDTQNENDFDLMAEAEVAEKLFATSTLHDSQFSAKEQQIRKLALSLFMSYFDIERRDEIMFGPSWGDPSVIQEYCDKAEKIFTCAGDYDTARKILNFLSIIDADAARTVVDNL